MAKKLYVDDWRSAPAEWSVARTVPEAIALLDEGGYEVVSLDFVIGDSTSDNFSPVARHIVKLPPEKRPRRVLIHTSSPDGARMLERILEGYVLTERV